MIVTSFDGDPIQTELGGAELLRLDPGAPWRVDATPGEQAVIVLEGAVQVTGEAPRTFEAAVGAVVLVGAGRAAAFRALERPVSMFRLHAYVPVPAAGGTDTRVVNAADLDDVVVHDPDRGFFRMTARMLVNGPSAGRRAFTVGMSTFAPGEGCHDLHRHAHAEELFYVWSGEGAHLSAHARPHGLRAGDLTWVAKTEDHGFRNTGANPVRAVFCYLGTDDRAAVGYELSSIDCGP